MRSGWLSVGWLAVLVAGFAGCDSQGTGDAASKGAGEGGAKAPVALLNVSYDPTRELYEDFNSVFAAHWKEKTGQQVTIEQSHGGSGKQARSVIDGLEADVVTLALAYDIDAIASKAGMLDADWQKRLPHNSSPYTSTIVFLVRKGNPKGIKDWPDLVREGVEVITANPKTGGGARWNYLAAWGSVLKRELGDLKKIQDPAQAEAVAAAQAKAKEFVADLYRHVAVLDPSARAATNSFVQRELGDVLIAWENEAFLAIRELGKDQFELVAPSVTILAEPPVAVVDKVANKRGTAEVAKAYLEYLYTAEGQKIIAKHFYRPVDPSAVTPEQLGQFAKVELFTIGDAFGSWTDAQKTHFDDGGIFDAIYQPADQGK